MRIVIDFQGAQTGSRFRGIGHYSTEFVKSLVCHCPDDDIFLALNGLFPDSIEQIRAEFDGILPQENIRVWYTPGPIEHFSEAPGNLREIAEITREYFLRSLEPDVILITSMFEGLSDSAVVTTKKFIKDVPIAAIFYDFTPLYLPDEQFQWNPVYRRWYRERIESLRHCDLLLAISESSRQELIKQLGTAPERIVNILGGRNEAFTCRTYRDDQRDEILQRFGITKPFILYTGGIEPSKNLKALIEALTYLPVGMRQKYEFVCVGKRNAGEVEQIQSFARDMTSLEMIRTVGFVSQSDLIDLYNLCDLFVFPSLREGLGLPPLEAMACGAPTIVSDRTSLPEVVGNPDALFDPLSPRSIAAKIAEVLSDQELQRSLVERGLDRARELTWDATCLSAAREIHTRFSSRASLDRSRRTVVSQTRLFKPNAKRIIIQKLDHHGDFLLGLPAMAKVRARYPDAKIEALVGSWNRTAAEACGLFDEIHTLDFFKAKSSLRAGIDDTELEMLVTQLPFYDYAIDLRRQTDTRFILVKLKADRYFGYRTGDERIDRLLTRPLEIHPDAGGERGYFDETHTCEQMLRIIEALPFDANDYVRLPDLGKRAPVRQGSVAIFPRVGNDARQWDSAYFEELIRSLAADPAVTEINLFCGRAAELDDIRYPRIEKVHIQAGLAFSDLFSALSANAVCVGNNSFGVHLAAYAGCRTIGIYSGHELPQQWGPPFGDSLTITVDAPCAPCHLPDRQSCPHDLFCLNDISVEVVKAAVLDSLAGHPVPENYSRITRNNPASAVKPLIDAVNKSKFSGRIDDLSREQRVAFAASVAINFPERVSARRCIYFDVSGLIERTLVGQATQTFKNVVATIETLRRQVGGAVVPVATGPHDHEFYAVDLGSIEETLYFGDRFRRIVRPIAGDVYVGLHTYTRRNPMQWNLLATWRQMGVFTIFGVPEMIDFESLSDRRSEESEVCASYLFAIAHFDALVSSTEPQSAVLKEWLEEFGPQRLRKIALSSNLLDLVDAHLRGSVASTSEKAAGSQNNGGGTAIRRLMTGRGDSHQDNALRSNRNVQ